MSALAGHILPGVPALVVNQRDGGVHLVNLTRSEVMSATGSFAAALRHWAETGDWQPQLGFFGQTPLGRGLAELVEQPRLPLTAAHALRLSGFDTLFLEVTGRCNEHCLHCYAASGPAEHARLSRVVCDSVLADARALGFRRVQLTGGEPLLCEFLPDLVARVNALGFAECEIFTNGLLLDHRTLGALARWRPAFAFSVYSYDPATHDAITGVEDSHRRTLGALARALGAGLAVRVAVVSMDANCGQISATVEYLARLGVELIGVSGARSVGRGATCGRGLDAAMGTEEASPASEPATGTLCVAPDGSVYPCIFNRLDRLGNVLERSLASIASAPELAPMESVDFEQVLSSALARLQCASCRLTACALAACAPARSKVC